MEGIALRTITHLESGDRLPGWDTVVAICQALGVTPDAFIQEPKPRAKPGRGRPRKSEG